MIQFEEDRYGGVTVDQASLPDSVDEFKEQLNTLTESLVDQKLLWVRVPASKSEFVPVLTKHGFEFHHCDENNVMLVKKIHEDSYVPTTKNYILGVGAIVMNKGKLLIVKDKFNSGYKLPGGHVDRYELLKDALKREVLEETGITVEFESIMNVGHFLSGQFGETNLYMVCTAKAVNFDIHINDDSEIIEAKWMDIDEYLSMEDVHNYNKAVVQASLTNKGLKLTEKHIPLRITGEVFM